MNRLSPSLLPAGVTCRRETLPDGNPAWCLSHTDLGDLGRLVVQPTADGQSRILTEMTLGGDEVMAERRREVFEPIAMVLNRELQRLPGKGQEEPVANDNTQPGSTHVVPSKMLQCSRCDGFHAHLVFVDDAITAGDLENAARLMYSKIRELDLPTWIVGASMERPVLVQARAMILKVWPDRQDIRWMTPDEFNATLEAVECRHCSARTRHRRDRGAGPAYRRTQNRAVGRNAPCPCGSGRKYKQCCLNA